LRGQGYGLKNRMGTICPLPFERDVVLKSRKDILYNCRMVAAAQAAIYFFKTGSRIRSGMMGEFTLITFHVIK
jgi:hypothetical protein